MHRVVLQVLTWPLATATAGSQSGRGSPGMDDAGPSSTQVGLSHSQGGRATNLQSGMIIPHQRRDSFAAVSSAPDPFDALPIRNIRPAAAEILHHGTLIKVITVSFVLHLSP